MSDGTVQPPSTNLGKLADADESAVGGETVERIRLEVPNEIRVSSAQLDAILAESKVRSTLLAQAFGVGDLDTLRMDAAQGLPDRGVSLAPVYPPNVAGNPSTFDEDTVAWAAAVISNGGGVSAGREALVDDLIVGLKADGVWTKLDRLWLFAAEDAPSALTDLVATATATAVNTPTFTVDQGYAGDGATSYLDTNFVPSTAGGNAALNSIHVSVYGQTFGSTGFFSGYIEGDDPGSFVGIVRFTVNGKVDYFLNEGSGGTETLSPAGMLIASRTGANAAALYSNGSSVDTNASASNALLSKSIFVLARNGNGTPTGFVSDEMSAASIGGGLTPTDATNLSSRVNTYMTAIGANVY